jgi:hypothetical protein
MNGWLQRKLVDQSMVKFDSLDIVLAGKDVKLGEQHCWSQGTEENIDTFSHTRRVSLCQRMLYVTHKIVREGHRKRPMIGHRAHQINMETLAVN